MHRYPFHPGPQLPLRLIVVALVEVSQVISSTSSQHELVEHLIMLSVALPTRPVVGSNIFTVNSTAPNTSAGAVYVNVQFFGVLTTMLDIDPTSGEIDKIF